MFRKNIEIFLSFVFVSDDFGVLGNHLKDLELSFSVKVRIRKV